MSLAKAVPKSPSTGTNTTTVVEAISTFYGQETLNLSVNPPAIQSREEDKVTPPKAFVVLIKESGLALLQIQRYGGTGKTPAWNIYRNGSLYYTMPDGSIVDPGNHPSKVYTVGAVRADRYI